MNTEHVYYREFGNSGTGASGTRVCPESSIFIFSLLIRTRYYLTGKFCWLSKRCGAYHNIIWIFVHYLGGHFIFVVIIRGQRKWNSLLQI